MPTSQEEFEVLAAFGFSPKTHRINPTTFEIEEIPTASPALSPEQTPTSFPKGPGINPLESFGRAAAENLFPAAASTLGGIGSAALAAPAGPVAQIGAGLAGSTAFGLGASALQEAVVPESIQSAIFSRPEDLEQNPVSSFAGQFIPNLVTGNPLKSFAQIPTLLKGAAKLPSAALMDKAIKVLTPAEKAALQNAAINVGGGFGADIGGQLVSGTEDVDLGGAALRSLVGGLAFSEPTAIGKRLGMTGVQDAADEAARGNAAVQNRAKLLRDAEIARAKSRQSAAVDPISGEVLDAARQARETETGNVAVQESQIADATIAQDTKQREFAANIKARKKEEHKAYLFQKQKEEDARRMDEATTEYRAARIAEQEAELKRATEESRRRAEDHKKAIEELSTQEAELQPKLDAAELDRLQRIDAAKQATRLKSSLEKGQVPGPIPEQTIARFQPAAEETKGAAPKTENEFLKSVNEEAARRGIKFRVVPEVRGPLDQQMAGVANVNTRESLMSGAAARPDTAKHEIAHTFVEDLLNSKNPNDVAVALEGLDYAAKQVDPTLSVKTPEDWANLPAKVKARVDETLVQSMGLEGSRRQLAKLPGVSQKSRFRRWTQDVGVSLRRKYGTSNPDDVIKILAAKQERDIPLASDPDVQKGYLERTADEARSVSYGRLTPREVALQRSKAKMEKKEKKKQAPLPTKAEVLNEKLTETRGQPAAESEGIDPQTRTPEFKKWFEGSKVVDERGEPLRVYHGTNQPNITIFDLDKAQGIYGRAVSTSPSPETARQFAGKFGVTYPLYAVVKNPVPKHIETALVHYWERGQKVPKRLLALIKQNGWDGVIATNDIMSDGEIAVFNPEQIKSAIGNRGTFDPSNPDIRYQESSSADATSMEEPSPLSDTKPGDLFHRIAGSQISQVRAIGSKAAEYLADKAQAFAERRSLNMGEYRNKIVETGSRYSKTERANVDKFGREMMMQGESSIALTDREQALYDETREYLAKVADVNDEINREITRNPNYWPQILDTAVAYQWKNHPNSAKSRVYDRQWMDHAMKRVADGDFSYSVDDLTEILRNYKDAIRGNDPNVTFGALRKAAGLGLPETMQDNNFLSRFRRYGERVAKDLAFATTLENDPATRWLLKLPDPETGKRMSEPPEDLPEGFDPAEDLKATKQVAGLEKFIYDDFSAANEPLLRASQKLVSAGILGTATGVRDLVSTGVNILPEVPTSELGKIVSALPKLRQAWKDSLAYNARQESIGDLEFGAAANPNKIVAGIDTLATLLRRASGRNWFDQVQRAYSFGVGKEVARSLFGKAVSGDVKAREWLTKFGKNVVEDLEGKMSGSSEILDEDLSKMAKLFTDRVAGTYDERGLPVWAVEGTFAPYLAMSRWSIEKANVIYDDVFKPMVKKGDYMPFLTYTLGAFMTGAAIRELNEMLNNKKQADATWDEAKEAKNNPELVRHLAGTFQLGGYGGLVSDLLKLSTDVATGHKPRGSAFSFPLLELTEETIAKNVAGFFSALNAGEDVIPSAIGMSQQIITDSIQSLRMIANRTWKKDDAERSEKFRDYRVYQELSGQRPPTLEFTTPNKLVRPELREFKQTDDLSKAVEILPKVFKRNFELAGGDFTELQRLFTGAKINNYQTMPDIERNPAAAAKFLGFVRKTQGPEAASAILRDYLKQKMINKAKSSMIPSVGT